MTVMLVIAITAWCKINSRECRFAPTTNSLMTSILSFGQQYDHLTDNDVSSEILNDNSLNTPNGRYLSLEPGDETPAGNLRNIELSERRTQAIRDYLVNNGYIKAEQVEVRAYGSNSPILQANPSAPLNRRVEVNLLCKQY